MATVGRIPFPPSTPLASGATGVGRTSSCRASLSDTAGPSRNRTVRSRTSHGHASDSSGGSSVTPSQRMKMVTTTVASSGSCISRNVGPVIFSLAGGSASRSGRPLRGVRTAVALSGQPRCCPPPRDEELSIPYTLPRLATTRPEMSDTDIEVPCDPWAAAAETCDLALGWCRGPIPYCPTDILGCGTFGKVYLADCPAESDGMVAIKAVAKTCEPQTGESNLGTRKRVAASLRKEAEMLEKMQDSPNVVQLKGLFEDEQYAYIAMEVCDRGDLQQLIDGHEGTVPERAVRCLARQMLMAIGHAHSQGICYSDIKPANFLLKSCDDDGDGDGWGNTLGVNVKLADFGCSQDLDDEFLTNRTGTPLYTAPEVYLGRYGLQADIWGIGMILYRLLAGMYPFRRNLDTIKPFSMMMSVMHDELRFDAKVWADISPEARDLVTSMLFRSTEKRITAAGALLHPWFELDMTDDELADTPLTEPLSANNIEPFSRRHTDLPKSTDTAA